MAIDFKDAESVRQIIEIAEIAATKALEKVGYKQKDLISQREAHRIFGATLVNRWVKQNRITPRKNGLANHCKILFSKTELQLLRKVDMRESKTIE